MSTVTLKVYDKTVTRKDGYWIDAPDDLMPLLDVEEEKWYLTDDAQLYTVDEDIKVAQYVADNLGGEVLSHTDRGMDVPVDSDKVY